jgi:tripartite-type tricarboxylate transporter receptor subunit TctC
VHQEEDESMTRTRRRAATLAVSLAGLSAATALAQETFPNRPLRIVNSLAAGSSGDQLNRLLADGLTARFKQRVLVDNRPGDGGNVAAMVVVKAPADGYTLLMASTASLAIQMTYNAGRLEYDLQRDLAPVSAVAQIANGLFVTPAIPAKNLAALVTQLRAKPGQYSCASSGVGGLLHLTCALFNRVAGVDALHVPYKGAAFRTDLMEGRVTIAFDNVPVYAPLVESGKLRILAVTTAPRIALLPEVPTAAELGMPELMSVGLFSLFAPLKTPADVVSLLSRETVAALADPALQDKLGRQGIDAAGSTPLALREQVEQEVARWARVFREAKIARE